MSFQSEISLIDLSKQLPFNIDDFLKQQLCFGESLIISCGHVEGNFQDILSNSECSTSESSISEEYENVEEIRPFEAIKQTEENNSEKSSEDDNDFHFYFFPDCAKPAPVVDSKSSFIIKNGMPQINPIKHQQTYCTCEVDNQGQCKCFTKIPCYCSAENYPECMCHALKNICICDERKPDMICSCKESEVCTCDPNGKPRLICTCGQIDKPCVCCPDKFPYPNCICEHKPVVQDSTYSYEVDGENQFDETSSITKKSPCECQKSHTPLCIQDCDKDVLCVCEPISEPTVCNGNDLKPSCSTNCPNPPDCSSCSNVNVTCKCFPTDKICTCGNPENCKCFHICQCSDPCICDTERKNKECTCFAQSANEIKQGNQKLKKVRAGKHGYRWCHDVDPRHTYFGYGYGRHEKITNNVDTEKIFKITDHKVEKDTVTVENVEKLNVPIYKKKLGNLSLDCCSAVGGITINVESLGEDKGKFLVQVVSHSSKEAAKTGSKIVSIIDCKLHTMEENRSEYIQSKDKFKEKRNYMAICESGYYNKVTRIYGDRHLIKRFYHTFEEAHNFLLEGANIVLMRYVGLTRYKGCIKTDTVLIGGVVCESIYVCLGVSHAIVNGRPFFVEKVERHIIEPSGYVHQTLLVLTLKGYIVSQEWTNNSYIIHINPLLRVVPERDEIEPHEPLRETWRNDLQLLSDYLDFKSARSSEGARYVSENGELTGTIRDYLQAVLLLRPSDALHFTKHYFGATLSVVDLPHNEYFDSSTKHVRYFFFEE